MHSAFCKLLDALGNIDDGVESVLTESAFDAMKDWVEHAYGKSAAEAFEFGWTQREDGSMVVSIENFSEHFCEKVGEQWKK